MKDRLRHRFRRRPRERIERILFGLHPSAFTNAVPGGEALRDAAGYARRLGGGQQVVRPLGSQLTTRHELRHESLS